MRIEGAIRIADANALGGILAAVAASVASIVAIVVGASMVLLDSAANRYPASIVDYLTQERSRSRVLSVLLLAFTFSLSSLLFQNRGPVTAIVSLALALISVSLLLGYLQSAILLFHPAGLSARLASEIPPWIDAMATAPNTNVSRSVAIGIQRRTAIYLVSLDELLISLVRKGESRPVAESLSSLRGLLDHYLKRRRRIPETSDWYPIGTIIQSEQQSDQSLLQMFQQSGLGPAQQQERDLYWFESATLRLFHRVADVAREHEERLVLYAMANYLEELLVTAWREQEIHTLDSLLDLADSIAGKAVSPEVDFLEEALMGAQIHLADEAAKIGFGLDRIRDEYLSILGSQAHIYSLQLPTILLGAFLDTQARLEAERAVSSQQITPSTVVVDDLRARLEQMEGENLQKLLDRVIQRQQATIRRALDSHQPEFASEMLRIGFQVFQRCATDFGRRSLAVQFLPQVLGSLDAVLEACPEGEVRIALFNQLRTFVLQSLSAGDSELVKESAPALVAAIASGNRLAGGKYAPTGLFSREVEALLVACGLAYFASEFTRDVRYLEVITAACTENQISLAHLASVIVPILDQRGQLSRLFGHSLIMEYHSFFVPYIQKVETLPERYTEAGEKGFGFVIGREHPSEFIGRSLHSMGLGVEECIEAFLRTLVAPTPHDDDEPVL